MHLDPLGLHEDGKVNQTVGVAPLVVVPADELVEGIAEVDAGLGIDDGGAGVVDKVLGDDGKVGVSKDPLELGTFRGGLEGGIDLLAGAGLGGTDGEIDHGHIGGGDTDGHAGELAVEGGEDLANRLGGTGRGGDHVGDGRTSAAPVLLGGAVDDHLGGRGGVDGGHEALLDAKVLVDDLGEGSEAVGGTGGVGNDVGGSIVGGVVDAHDEHGSVGGGGRDDDLLGTAAEMSRGLLDGGEDAGGFAHNLGTGLAPANVGGVALGVELDTLVADDEAIAVDNDLTGVGAVDGIVLELVGGVCIFIC